jgi:hypothetical protein
MDRGLLRASELGYGAAMLTLTVRHHKGQSLSELLAEVSACRAAIGRSGSFKRAVKAAGYVGRIIVLEVTYGSNGWHPHVHMLFLFNRRLSESEQQVIADAAFGAWQAQAVADGFSAPLSQAQEWPEVELAGQLDTATAGLSEYWTKAVYELGSAQTKSARSKEGATFWQLLDRWITDRDDATLRLLHEYETSIAGQKAIYWTKGLKRRLGVAQVTDEELAEEEVGTDEDTILGLPAESWWALNRIEHGPADLLTIAELQGPLAAMEFLEILLIPFDIPIIR